MMRHAIGRLLCRGKGNVGFALLAGCILSACGGPSPQPAQAITERCVGDSFGEFIDIPAGQFRKGAYPVYAEEQPSMTVHVGAFQILAHEVTNSQFAAFVDATGYVTDAERSAEAGGPGAGSAVFSHPGEGVNVRDSWELVPGATWRRPAGPGSDIDGMGAYPVVHVSQADARAYAQWAGARLPSEVEWEYAAILGLDDPTDPVSGAYGENGQPIANTWQGPFPVVDTQDDGYGGLAPAGCYVPSKVGLYDMIGNVWEWTDTPYAPGQHAIKGGSFLCAENFCRRYRPAARQPQYSDFSSSHIGFRIVRDLDPES